MRPNLETGLREVARVSPPRCMYGRKSIAPPVFTGFIAVVLMMGAPPAPQTAGQYEMRYIMGRSTRTLVRRSMTVR